MGTVYSGTGRYPDAIREFRKALELDSRAVDTHLELGQVYVRAKEFANAEASFRKAIELQRQDWRGYKELGLLYYRQSDYQGAVEQFERVVDLTPDNSSAYTNLGAFYGLLKNPQKSEEMLDKALKLEPRRISALTNMAKLLFDQGRYAEAAVRWEQAAAVDGASYRLWGNLGGVYMRLNRVEEGQKSYESAIRLLDKAIAVNPKNGELYSYRAHFFAPLGRKKEALADLARTDSMNGTEKEMLVRDADTFVELKEISRAQQLLKKAFELGYSRAEAARNDRLRPALQNMQ